MSSMNKDFYNYLPAYLTRALDSCIEIYGDKPWFAEAWEEYRYMARSLNARRMPTPNKFFGEKDIQEKLPEQEPNEFQKHYEENFRPTVQEQVRKDFRNGKNNKFYKKNRKFNS